MPAPAPYIAARAALDAAAAAGGGTDRKALVVVYLGGGVDHFNWLTPRAGANRTSYEAYRPNARIAVNANTQLGASNLQLHPSWYSATATSNFMDVYNAGKLAFFQNVGALVEPVTKAAYEAKTANLPPQLFSHSDQSNLWETGIANQPTSATGWLGRLAELLAPSFNSASTIPMGISFAGNRRSFFGYDERSLGCGPTGLAPRTIQDAAAAVATICNDHYAAIASDPNATPMMRQLALEQLRSEAATGTIASAISAAGNPVTTYPSGTLADQLKTCARLIKQQSTLGHRRSVHFITQGGYDQHAGLIADLQTRFNTLVPALKAFWNTMQSGDFNLANTVVLIYTEFGRTMTENSSLGSDHGWGGHAAAFGVPVTGGLYGTYPSDLAVATPGNRVVDGRGYLIPTMPFESLYATLAKWMGVPDVLANGVNPMNLLLPNLPSFPNSGDSARNLGFLP